jgi:hypothetical protein
MNFGGTWHLQVGQVFIGPDFDRNQLPTILLKDGKITLPDGSHPEVRHQSAASSGKGYATFEFDMTQADGSFARIFIDAGSRDAMTGTIYVSDQPLPEALDDDDLHATVCPMPVALFRTEYLDRVDRERALLAEGYWSFGDDVLPVAPSEDGTSLVAVARPAQPALH